MNSGGRHHARELHAALMGLLRVLTCVSQQSLTTTASRFQNRFLWGGYDWGAFEADILSSVHLFQTDGDRPPHVTTAAVTCSG